MLDSLPEEELPALGLLLTGGEPVSAATVDRWSGTRRFLVAYGVTEATVTTTLGRVLPGEQPSIGQPIANIRLHVLDAAATTAANRSRGEVFAGGAGVAARVRGTARPDQRPVHSDPCAGEDRGSTGPATSPGFRRTATLESSGASDAQ